METYLNKVSKHHYQVNADKENKGNALLFIPKLVGEERIMIIITICQSGRISINLEKHCDKISFKQQLFHTRRYPNNKVTSIKRTKYHSDIINKVDSLINERMEDLELVIDTWSGPRNILLEIEKLLK